MEAKPASGTIKLSKWVFVQCRIKQINKMINCQNVHRNLPVLLKNFATDEAITTDNLVNKEL